MPLRTALLVFVLGIFAFGSTIEPVAAATSSATISVSASVQASCMASVSPMATTAIRSKAAEAAMSPFASVSCSNLVPYNISVAAGVSQTTAKIQHGSGSRFLAPNGTLVRASDPVIVVVMY